MLALHGAHHLAEGVARLEGGAAGALRVVLVRDQRAEQRHDAVARVLVDRAFEAVHRVGQHREEALAAQIPRLNPVLGSDDLSNRTTLCAAHHLRGVHAGIIRIRGRAPDGLRFEFPFATSGPGERLVSA